ncbi:hypothetical protein CE91St36_03930 [Christensenellaceae bacterium]|nr:hypothetical protein CE91St36_03930 [Christensenellaceae bacterium]BDF60244.1 hypothetical protein CE91St37_03940 [Christensenellaceae bacterium]
MNIMVIGDIGVFSHMADYFLPRAFTQFLRCPGTTLTMTPSSRRTRYEEKITRFFMLCLEIV